MIDRRRNVASVDPYSPSPRAEVRCGASWCSWREAAEVEGETCSRDPEPLKDRSRHDAKLRSGNLPFVAIEDFQEYGEDICLDMDVRSVVKEVMAEAVQNSKGGQRGWENPFPAYASMEDVHRRFIESFGYEIVLATWRKGVRHWFALVCSDLCHLHHVCLEDMDASSRDQWVLIPLSHVERINLASPHPMSMDQGMLAKSKETGRAGVRDTDEHACEVEGMRGDVSKLRQAVRLSFLAAESRGAGGHVEIPLSTLHRRYEEQYSCPLNLGCFESLGEMVACECSDLCTLSVEKGTGIRKIVAKRNLQGRDPIKSTRATSQEHIQEIADGMSAVRCTTTKRQKCRHDKIVWNPPVDRHSSLSGLKITIGKDVKRQSTAKERLLQKNCSSKRQRKRQVRLVSCNDEGTEFIDHKMGELGSRHHAELSLPSNRMHGKMKRSEENLHRKADNDVLLSKYRMKQASSSGLHGQSVAACMRAYSTFSPTEIANQQPERPISIPATAVDSQHVLEGSKSCVKIAITECAAHSCTKESPSTKQRPKQKQRLSRSTLACSAVQQHQELSTSDSEVHENLPSMHHPLSSLTPAQQTALFLRSISRGPLTLTLDEVTPKGTHMAPCNISPAVLPARKSLMNDHQMPQLPEFSGHAFAALPEKRSQIASKTPQDRVESPLLWSANAITPQEWIEKASLPLNAGQTTPAPDDAYQSRSRSRSNSPMLSRSSSRSRSPSRKFGMGHRYSRSRSRTCSRLPSRRGGSSSIIGERSMTQNRRYSRGRSGNRSCSRSRSPWRRYRSRSLSPTVKNNTGGSMLPGTYISAAQAWHYSQTSVSINRKANLELKEITHLPSQLNSAVEKSQPKVMKPLWTCSYK